MRWDHPLHAKTLILRSKGRTGKFLDRSFPRAFVFSRSKFTGRLGLSCLDVCLYGPPFGNRFLSNWIMRDFSGSFHDSQSVYVPVRTLLFRPTLPFRIIASVPGHCFRILEVARPTTESNRCFNGSDYRIIFTRKDEHPRCRFEIEKGMLDGRQDLAPGSRYGLG